MEIKYLLAFGIALVLTLLVMPRFIPFLHKLKFGQSMRLEGPKSHMVNSDDGRNRLCIDTDFGFVAFGLSGIFLCGNADCRIGLFGICFNRLY